MGALRSVLAAGTYDVRSHPRVAVLIEGLVAHGISVEEHVAPLRLTTAERVEILKRPSRLPRLGVAIVRSWRRLVPDLVRRRRRSPRPDAVLVGYLGQFDAPLVRRLTRPAPLVLDFLVSGAATALDRGERGGLKQVALRRLDEVALRSADLILVDTEEHLDVLPERHRPRAVVVPVGADARWSAAGRRAVQPPGDRMSVVFYGLFTPLQGAPVIAEALRRLDGLVDATIIGTGQDEAEVDRVLKGVRGVRRMRWVEAERLPDLVASHDVCLGVFGSGDKARRVVPNKVYQGAMAGCAVVTSDTPPQRRMLGDAAVFVPPGDPDALAVALRDLAADAGRRGEFARAAHALATARFTSEAAVEPLVTALREMV